jgi:hypothetical protein
MKKTAGTLVLLASTVIFLCASIGCDTNVTVTLDTTSYSEGDNGTATLHNKAAATAYLPGCSQFSYEKLVDGQWTDQGPNVVCVWEGIVVPVAPSDSYASAFIAKNAGTWRLRYLVAFGCTEGKPMSTADCQTQTYIYSPEFQVAAASPDTGCLATGGTIGKANCCRSSGDFPDSCLIGPCGCAPEYSHEVSICVCPDDMCFDGTACVIR